METLGLKSINMLSKEQYENIEQPAHDELYVVSHSGIGFPSANYEDLELGASGTEYVAPANGWVTIAKVSSASAQVLSLAARGMPTTNYSSGSGQGLKVYIPVVKGETFVVDYTAGGATERFRFIYAEGE